MPRVIPFDTPAAQAAQGERRCDPAGALKLIKAIEPKLVIPTHYADKALKFPVPQQELSNALKELAMEPKEKVTKLKLKPSEITDITHLIILEKS